MSTHLFEQIDDFETAKDNVKKRIELLIRENGKTFAAKNEVPASLKFIE